MQEIIDSLSVLNRQRNDHQKARIALGNQIWAICGRYNRLKDSFKFDKIATEKMKKEVLKRENVLLQGYCESIVDSYDALKTKEKEITKEMTTLVKQFPVYDWVLAQKGAGALNFAIIMAEAGRDLSDYSNPAKLKKRFGLSVENGVAPRKEKGKSLDYHVRRRKVMHSVGECLMKAHGKWREVYLWRKQYEKDKAKERGLTVVPSKDIPKDKADQFMSDGHVHARALRYTEQKFLIALWNEWTGNTMDYGLIKTLMKGT